MTTIDTARIENRANAIKREVGVKRNRILNGVHTRKHHPSYGVTKAALSADLHQLEGLLYAWLTVTTGAESAAFGSQVNIAASECEVDLHHLRSAIKAS